MKLFDAHTSTTTRIERSAMARMPHAPLTARLAAKSIANGWISASIHEQLDDQTLARAKRQMSAKLTRVQEPMLAADLLMFGTQMQRRGARVVGLIDVHATLQQEANDTRVSLGRSDV